VAEALTPLIRDHAQEEFVEEVAGHQQGSPTPDPESGELSGRHPAARNFVALCQAHQGVQMGSERVFAAEMEDHAPANHVPKVNMRQSVSFPNDDPARMVISRSGKKGIRDTFNGGGQCRILYQ